MAETISLRNFTTLASKQLRVIILYNLCIECDLRYNTDDLQLDLMDQRSNGNPKSKKSPLYFSSLCTFGLVTWFCFSCQLDFCLIFIRQLYSFWRCFSHPFYNITLALQRKKKKISLHLCFILFPNHAILPRTLHLNIIKSHNLSFWWTLNLITTNHFFGNKLEASQLIQVVQLIFINVI